MPGGATALIPRTTGMPPDKVAAALEKTARGHARSIAELSAAAQAAAAAAPRFIANVELRDGIETKVEHQLGHKPRFVRESCPRGGLAAGIVVLVPSADAAAPYDETRYVVLKASGYAATVTIDVEVTP